MSGNKKALRFSVGFDPFFRFEISTEKDGKPGKDSLIRYGDRVAIRTYDGWYWQANRDKDERIMALAKHIRDWEIFQIVAVGDEFVSRKDRVAEYGDDIAFRFPGNDCFIGSELSLYPYELAARVPWVKEWESFKAHRGVRAMSLGRKTSEKDKFLRYGSRVSFAASNGKFVVFDKDESKQMLACSDVLSEWETFVFRHPAEIV